MRVFFKLYMIISIAILVIYAAAGFSGRLCRSPRIQDSDDFDPETVRATPGGYRSMSLWHVGLHGGK